VRDFVRNTCFHSGFNNFFSNDLDNPIEYAQDDVLLIQPVKHRIIVVLATLHDTYDRVAPTICLTPAAISIFVQATPAAPIPLNTTLMSNI
jgi:hypothetical protein